jgi:nucleoside-diphosphate-sugar epimerase
MRVLLAGATGVIGQQMVPLLRAAGHEVVGTTRDAARAPLLRRLGAEPLVLDVLDRRAVAASLAQIRPEAILHQLTSLANWDFAATNRLRIIGTRHLVEAAHRLGIEHIVAQSLALYAAGPGPARETDPLAGPEVFGGTTEAIRALEAAVQEVPHAVLLRYGRLYGPGTWLGPDGALAEQVRRGELAVTEEVSSFVHVADAAAAAVAALQWPGGVVNIVDDTPAPAADWLPYLAGLLGGPSPASSRSLEGSGWLRAVSNEKARTRLQWQPRFVTWREGFAATFAETSSSAC